MNFDHGDVYFGEIANRESSFNRAIGCPVAWPKTSEAEPGHAEPAVLKFDDITPKTFGGPHLLNGLTRQYQELGLDELDIMTKAFELLRTRVVTGRFRSDLINVNIQFNWTGLNILCNSLAGFTQQDQLRHINFNLNSIRGVIKEKVAESLSQTVQVVHEVELKEVASEVVLQEVAPEVELEENVKEDTLSERLAKLLGVKTSPEKSTALVQLSAVESSSVKPSSALKVSAVRPIRILMRPQTFERSYERSI